MWCDTRRSQRLDHERRDVEAERGAEHDDRVEPVWRREHGLERQNTAQRIADPIDGSDVFLIQNGDQVRNKVGARIIILRNRARAG